MKTKQEMMDEMLFDAVKENKPEEVKGLLALGANVNDKNGLCWDTFNQTPLHWSCMFRNRNDAHITKMLIEAGADVNAKDSIDWTPLHYAIEVEKVDTVKMLIEAGADVNANSTNVWTPLREAMVHCNAKLVSLLIKHGADVNSQDNDGNTPLHIIIHEAIELDCNGYFPKDILNMLIKAGANLESKNSKNETPLEFLKRLGEGITYEKFGNCYKSIMKTYKNLKKIFEKAIQDRDMNFKAEEERHEEELKARIFAEMDVVLNS